MDKFRRVIDWFWEGLNLLMSAAMVLMIILVFVNVVLRYGFNSGILMSAELSRYLFVWVTFLGAILCMRKRDHLELRLIESFIPPKALFVLRRVVYAIIMVCCYMLVKGSYTQVDMNWYNKMPMSGVPVSLLYLAGVVGGTAMGLIALHRFLVPSADKAGDEEV
ncbi:TRAP transporter small permease [Polycladidibacter stylochi]|uniref:TRAP transporter small permease n=1 Tax=Polycladidibacter stylochi TaxID=1807766 RepID=UPI000836D2DC|nr:TRAP transporter small permease [Pseudovibrio stylochi]